MKYLLIAQKGDNIAEILVNTVQSIKDKEYEEAGMSLGLQLKRMGREEGRQEGRQEGRDVGRKEGRTEERHEIARKMLERGVDLLTIKECTGLCDDTLTYLRNRLP